MLTWKHVSYREGQEGTLFSDWPTCWLWHLSQYLCWAGPNCVGQAKLSLQSLSAQLSPNSATVVRLNNQAVARRNGSGQQSRWITHWYWDYYSSSRAALYFFFNFSVFGIFMVGISGSSRHNHTFTVWENHFTLCLALKERRWWEFNIQDSGCSCHWCLTTRRMWVWTSCCLCAHSFFPQSKGMHVMLIGCRYGCDHEGSLIYLTHSQFTLYTHIKKVKCFLKTLKAKIQAKVNLRHDVYLFINTWKYCKTYQFHLKLQN